MTILKTVQPACWLGNFSSSSDGWNGSEELMLYAYYLGRHEAAVECCKKARKIFIDQLQRVEKSRYHKMAIQIQGNIRNIYHDDYSNDFIDAFKDDELSEECEEILKREAELIKKA